MDIKQEFPSPEVIPQPERESFSEDVKMTLNNAGNESQSMCETEIKEERIDSDFSLQNKFLCFSEGLVKKVKQCHDDEMETKTEMSEECADTEFCPENKRQFIPEVPVVTYFNPCSKDSDLETKIKVKEEMPWLESNSTETPCIDDVTKDWVDGSFPSTESLRLYNEETSRDESTLFLDENSSSTARFNITQDSSECEIARNYTNKEIEVPKVSSVRKNVKTKQHEGAQTVRLKITSQSDFKRLKLTHAGVEQPKCDICGKSFLRLSSIKRHKLTHEGIKPYKCDTCSKHFTSMINLKRHILIHEGIKSHKCDTCGKSFTQLIHLKRHKWIHEGIKPHKCDTCGKCFTSLTNFEVHKLTHEGLKPHKCDTCGKCFTQSTHLKTHMLIHEGIKPHKCDTCGKCFTQLIQLKMHKLIHEGIKSHKCVTCGKCFTRSTHLKRHERTH